MKTHTDSNRSSEVGLVDPLSCRQFMGVVASRSVLVPESFLI